MTYEFLIKVILSFLIGGFWISATTLFTENKGSKIGGLISGLPSTILLACVFIGITQEPDFVAQAMQTLPLALIIDNIFLLILILLIGKGLFKSLTIGLAAWLLLAIGFNYITGLNYYLSILIFLTVTFCILFVTEKILKIESAKENKKPYTKTQIITRGLFGGMIIATATITAKLLGTYWAGIMSAFPAMFMSSMIILSRNQSPKFAQATGKILILSSISPLIFSSAVIYTYPHFGIVFGTIISYLIAGIWTTIAYPIVKKLA
ncbi:MAG: DUF3147 family protein [Candidatus Gracilibacteria bacterium]|jgi:hypothetical protein